jgi:ribosomal protein S27AE
MSAAVSLVCGIGLSLANNSERVCPACHGIMVFRSDLTGCARWVCRRCGYTMT